jgi:transcriptional regulator with XRE-family HTH domain
MNIKKLNAVMFERGITKKELAVAAEVSEAYISRVTNGRQPPSVAVLKSIAEYLGMTMDELS